MGGGHGATAEEHVVLCAVLPCCSDSLAATSREAVGKLGLRHTARRGLRRAGLPGAGAAGAGCDDAARAADAVSTAPRLRRATVRWWGRAVGSAPEAIDTVVQQAEDDGLGSFYQSP